MAAKKRGRSPLQQLQAAVDEVMKAFGGRGSRGRRKRASSSRGGRKSTASRGGRKSTTSRGGRKSTASRGRTATSRGRSRSRS